MPRKTFTFEGKRYDVTAPTEAELIAKIALKKRDLEEGRKQITKNMTVAAWAKEWGETYKQGIVSDDWYKSIWSIVSNKILSQVGTLKLSQVKPVHIQKILTENESYSATYITKIYNIIHEIFEAAKLNGLVLDNPVEGTRKPAGKRANKRRSITDHERRYMLSLASHHRGGLFYMIMLYSGLRPGEVAALQWRCVDFKKKQINIECALKADGTIGPPKSAAGLRTVFIPQEFLPWLEKVKSGPFEYVCTQSSGKRHTDSSLRQLWNSFKYRLNIEMGCQTFKGAIVPPYRVADDLIPYCLRHTYCTDLQAAGVPINVARELMGHEDISTTSRIYTHSSEESYSAAANAVDRLHKDRRVGTDVGRAAASIEK